MNNVDKVMQSIQRLKDFSDYMLPISKANDLIGLLKDRGFGERDRLFRKLVEEVGEYAEAIEYEQGAERKVAKFEGKVSPKEKLVEEVVDVVIVALALARIEGLRVEGVLGAINSKLGDVEEEFQRAKYEGWLCCPECDEPMFAPLTPDAIDPEEMSDKHEYYFEETHVSRCNRCRTLSWISIYDDQAAVCTDWEKG